MSIFGTPVFKQSTTSNQVTTPAFTTIETDLLVFVVRYYQTSVSSVSDTLNNTYTLGLTYTPDENNYLSIYYCLSSKASGSNEITANGASNGWVCAWDVPLSGTAEVDVSNSGYGSAPPISVEISTTGTDELVFAAMDLLQGPGGSSNVSFVTSGWTLDSAGIYNTSNNQGGAGHIAFSAVETNYTVEMTSQADANSIVEVLSFKSSAPPPSTVGNTPLGFVIVDFDSNGLPIAELQTGTNS